MNKRVIAVLVCTLLALVAATVWVPRRVREGRLIGAAVTDIRYEWLWTETRNVSFPRARIVGGTTGPVVTSVGSTTAWSIVFLEHALILLIGGGLLTWVVRRERQRKAAV